MKCRCAVLLTLFVLPAVPAVADHQSCESPLPFVLNLALPRLPKAYGFDAESLKRGVERFMVDFYQEHGRCPHDRPLQVNITVASEYEILDWLSQGLVQAAVIPELTLYLLTERDGLDLRVLDLEEHPVGELLLPALGGRAGSGRLSGGTFRPGDTGKDLEAFRMQLWRAAKGEGSGGDGPRYRIVLASHLSTTGFLDPLLDTARWLDKKLAGQAGHDELRERFWRAFFENARFAVDCDSLEPARPLTERSCWELPKAEEMAGEGPVEILFPGESALRHERGWAYARASAGSGGPGDSYREHLVIAGPETETIFDGGHAFQPAVPARGRELRALFGDPKTGTPPRAFLPILEPEPLFGGRSFGFTVDEAVRLLRQDQATSERAELALVLPGGGVKAAYQSRIVDDLYSRGYLKNFRVRDSRGRKPLDVRYVIGTSGGALLGFFVSQLREDGPEGLTDILWKKDARRGIYLRSSDVFGWTDLLRYASVVTSFLVLCSLLGLLSIPERGPLTPAGRPAFAAWRLRLTLAVVPLLLLAPLLVRYSNQKSPAAQEQIPEFEGLIYAVLAMLAMFADQCMILERQPRKNGRPWAPPSLPVLFGAGLIAFALHGNGWASAPLTFWPAYAVLAPLVLFCGLILPLRIRASSTGRGMRGNARLALEILAPTGLALLLGVPLAGDAGDQMSSIKIPFYITGFALVLLLLLANFFLRPSTARLQGGAWWVGYGTSLLLASLLVINLCWPGEQPDGPGSALSAHTLELSVGTFLLCVGLLVTFAGAVSWAYAAQPRYHLARTHDFLIGFVVVLAHMVAVALILWTVTEVLPDRLSPLELTGEFWTWLIGASLVLGLILLGIALLGREHSRLVQQLRRSFLFLCSHHPNGEFVTRRFLRVAVFCVFALGWWNLVVAPALYGNRQARRYLDGAVARFYDKAGTDARYHPTTRFIAPANLLERDGTRYFLFVPEGDECPPVPRRPTSGAIWYPYSVYSELAAPRGCAQLKQDDFLTRVIFASGSPFPIFPAHRLSLDGQEVSLVDGGYSNNTPVDAARTVSAEQVLIVESSNPLQERSSPSPWFQGALSVRGKLVENLGRLPGFLFERSQQVDRLSRRDLFVISISPSREEKDWPPLFDFRRTTVQRMEEVAKADLARRVGMVQSWGRPSFPLSVLVEKPERGAHEPHEH